MQQTQAWLFNNLQKWTPFSAIILLAAGFCIFVGVWDVVHGVPIPTYVFGLFSFLVGGTGATTLISHGVTVANGVANDTARAVVQEVVKSVPIPTSTKGDSTNA